MQILQKIREAALGTESLQVFIGEFLFMQRKYVTVV